MKEVTASVEQGRVASRCLQWVAVKNGGHRDRWTPTEAQQPIVLEAVSFAIQDELYGEDIGAAITLREGWETSSEELRAWFGQRMVKIKNPRKLTTHKQPPTWLS